MILLQFSRILSISLFITHKGEIIIENKTFTPRQIYDRIFKRIFSLSDMTIINLINGLFQKDFPLDSSVTYPNKEFVRADLKDRLADIFLTIGNAHTFHLEAQMAKDNQILLRIFEYSFYHAMSTQKAPDCLNFPEPIVIYLTPQKSLPEESVLHISFGNQGTFDYRIKNYVYLAHSAEELNQQKMSALIPFQMLRLRNFLVSELRQTDTQNPFPSEEFFQLRESTQDDIIKSIELNLHLGNITLDDASQLLELTNQLYEHICSNFCKETKGDVKNMKPLLPGALELPNDKYRFRIDELEKKITEYADKNAKYADEITRYADENAKYADEILKLKKRIAELEKQ